MLPLVIGIITFIIIVIIYLKVVKKTNLFNKKDTNLIEIEKDIEQLNKMVVSITQ